MQMLWHTSGQNTKHTYLCKRVICVHEGFLTYDGKLEKLLTKLSPNKDISLICRSIEDLHKIKNLGLEIKNISNNEITLTIKKSDIKETLKKILTKYEIDDLHINEPPIDEIIGKLLVNKK